MPVGVIRKSQKRLDLKNEKMISFRLMYTEMIFTTSRSFVAT